VDTEGLEDWQIRAGIKGMSDADRKRALEKMRDAARRLRALNAGKELTEADREVEELCRLTKAMIREGFEFPPGEDWQMKLEFTHMSDAKRKTVLETARMAARRLGLSSEGTEDWET